MAEPGGGLCAACAINARHDSRIGKYPTVTVVLLASAVAAIIAVPFTLAGDDTRDKPTQTAAADDLELEAALAPDVASVNEDSWPTELEMEEYEAKLEADFISRLDANGVMVTSNEKAIRLGNQICTVIATVPAKFSDEFARNQAESILVGEGYSTEAASAYVSAALGALC